MKKVVSTYHQMLSFFTNQGQMEVYDDQRSFRQCYSMSLPTKGDSVASDNPLK